MNGWIIYPDLIPVNLANSDSIFSATPCKISIVRSVEDGKGTTRCSRLVGTDIMKGDILDSGVDS